MTSKQILHEWDQVSLDRSCSEQSLEAGTVAEISKTILAFLSDHKRNTLILEGEMGAGKTSFAKHLLIQLGLNPLDFSGSPTFTVMQEYGFYSDFFKRDVRVAHIDFYRTTLLEDFNRDQYDLVLVEWFGLLTADQRQLYGLGEEACLTLSILPHQEDKRDYCLAMGSVPLI